MVTRRRLGIVLITTMLTVALVAMMLAAIIQSSVGNMALSGNFYDRESALWAAESGVQYAMTCLQTNKYWRGDRNNTFGSLSQGICVEESNGNVIGLIKNRNNGALSAFRIKFNYEDNSEDTTNKATLNTFDEDSKFHLAMPYVSVNYLNPITDNDEAKFTKVYRAKTNGQGIDDNTTNLEAGGSSDFAYQLPANTCSLIVEGLSGNALRDVTTPEQLNELLNSGTANNNLTKRYVETYLGPQAANAKSEGVTPAQCAGQLNIETANNGTISLGLMGIDINADGVNPNTVELHANQGIALKGNANIKIYDATMGGDESQDGTLKRASFSTNLKSADSDTGYEISINGKNFTPKSSASYQTINSGNSTIAATFQAKNATPTSIGWNDIRKASPTDTNMSGIYEWQKVSKGDITGYQLIHYTDVKTEAQAFDRKGAFLLSPDHDAYEVVAIDPKLKTEDMPEIKGLGAGLEVDCEKLTITVKGKVYCDGDLVIRAADGLVTSDSSGTGELAARPVFSFEITDKDGTLLTSEGSINLAGEVKGSGFIAAQQDITFQGPSDLASSNKLTENMSIYAGNDVNLMPITAVSVEDAAHGLKPGTSVATEDDLDGLLDSSSEEQIIPVNGSEIQMYPIFFPMGWRPQLTQAGMNRIADLVNQKIGHDYSYKKLVNDYGVYNVTKKAKCTVPWITVFYISFPDFDHATCTCETVEIHYINKSDNNKLPLDQATLDRIKNDLNQMVRTYNYADQRIKGAIYAGRNFNAGLAATKDDSVTSLSGTHNFILEGNLIAHGKEQGTGDINISGFDYNRLYVDPSSTALLNMLGNATRLKRIMWASW